MEIQATISFGGRAWSIDSADMNLGSISETDNDLCLGALFDLADAIDFEDDGHPRWLIGDTLLVRHPLREFSCRY